MHNMDNSLLDDMKNRFMDNPKQDRVVSEADSKLLKKKREIIAKFLMD